ncbi:MAG: pirin family protein [Xanthomonadaceae bacterium]|nr:pirin family protein [Xanthomonadaceae bacterium]
MSPRFRPAAERGRFTDPGLSGVAAFSHAGAFDRDWLGFGALRVLNRLELAPGQALPPARRANMEILSLVLDGQFRSRSQAGDSGPLAAGQWHRLAAGAGVDAIEENPDPQRPLRLLQLWVQPRHSNARPLAAVAAPAPGDALVAAPPGHRPAPVFDWDVAATLQRRALAPGGSLPLPAGACWIEALGGEASLGGGLLRAGDGVAVAAGEGRVLVSSFGADLLLLELPATAANG